MKRTDQARRITCATGGSPAGVDRQQESQLPIVSPRKAAHAEDGMLRVSRAPGSTIVGAPEMPPSAFPGKPPGPAGPSACTEVRGRTPVARPEAVRLPSSPPDPLELAAPLTFFLTLRQRRAVLRALRRIHRDRAAALLRILRPLIDEEVAQ